MAQWEYKQVTWYARPVPKDEVEQWQAIVPFPGLIEPYIGDKSKVLLGYGEIRNLNEHGDDHEYFHMLETEITNLIRDEWELHLFDRDGDTETYIFRKEVPHRVFGGLLTKEATAK